MTNDKFITLMFKIHQIDRDTFIQDLCNQCLKVIDKANHFKEIKLTLHDYLVQTEIFYDNFKPHLLKEIKEVEDNIIFRSEHSLYNAFISYIDTFNVEDEEVIDILLNASKDPLFKKFLILQEQAKQEEIQGFLDSGLSYDKALDKAYGIKSLFNDYGAMFSCFEAMIDFFKIIKPDLFKHLKII